MVFVFYALGATAGWAGDLILSRDVLEDRAGKLSLDQVAHMAFQPIGLLLAKGYTDSVFWVKLRVKPPQKGAEAVLRIRPTFLDEIRLYEPDPLHPGRWASRVTGDRYPFNQRDRSSISFEFVVYPKAPYTTYYLRMKTTSSALLFIQGLTPRETFQKNLNSNLFQIVFLSVMCWLLFMAAQNYFHSHDRVAAWFVLYQCAYISYDLSVSGYLAPLLPADVSPWADTMTSVAAICIPFCAVLFFRAVYKLYESAAILLRIFTALLVLFPIEVCLIITGHARIALGMNALSVFPILLFLPLMAFTARRENTPSRRVLRIVSLLQTSTLLIFLFPIMGWYGNIKAELTLDAPLFHGMLSAAMMFGILHIRTRRMIESAQHAKLQLELASVQLGMERDQLQKQGRFMAMLTHELKTPLSAVRLILDLKHPSENARQHAIQAVKDMDSVIERCLQSDRLDQAEWKSHRQPCRMEVVWEEIRFGCSSPERFATISETLPELHTDLQILRVILGNLADNALKYGAPDAKIRIQMVRSDLAQRPAVCFSMENMPGSAGLPDPEKVFSKYYRNPNAHSRTGSGLGLYLVHGFAQMLDGRVTYQEVEGRARFTLWIPC